MRSGRAASRPISMSNPAEARLNESVIKSRSIQILPFDIPPCGMSAQMSAEVAEGMRLSSISLDQALQNVSSFVHHSTEQGGTPTFDFLA